MLHTPSMRDYNLIFFTDKERNKGRNKNENDLKGASMPLYENRASCNVVGVNVNTCGQ